MSQWKITVESTIVTDHAVEGDTADEAERAALKEASKEVPGAAEHVCVEFEELE